MKERTIVFALSFREPASSACASRLCNTRCNFPYGNLTTLQRTTYNLQRTTYNFVSRWLVVFSCQLSVFSCQLSVACLRRQVSYHCRASSVSVQETIRLVSPRGSCVPDSSRSVRYGCWQGDTREVPGRGRGGGCTHARMYDTQNMYNPDRWAPDRAQKKHG